MLLKNDLRVLDINGTKFYHNEGSHPRFMFDPQAIVGWDDGVDVRRESTERPISDGDFTERGRLGSRLVTITGTAVSNTIQELHTMRDQFVGLLSDGEYSPVSLSNGSDTRHISAGLGGAPSWIQLFDTSASFKLDLYSSDPRMYGNVENVQLQSAGDAFHGLTYPLTYPMKFASEGTVIIQNKPITNYGNIETWPTFKITGDYPSGFKLRKYPTGEEVIYSGAVFMSSPVTIDFASGSATVNGVDRTYLLAKREWFPIPPKNQPISVRFIPFQEGNGWCDITYRSAWV